MWKEGFRLFNYDTRIDAQSFVLVSVGAVIALLVYCLLFPPKRHPRAFLKFLLAEYAVIVLLVTVVLRDKVAFPESYRFSFWGEKSKIIENGFSEMVANILLFVPFGLLAYAILNKCRWSEIFLVGVAFSLAIELLQFLLQRGVADVNDVIFNCIGFVVGCFCWQVVKLF